MEFFESVHVTQSMSKVGYPYDNAPMERYFNTLKNECTNLYSFQTEESLYRTIEEFAYVTYNHVRPRSFLRALLHSSSTCSFAKPNCFAICRYVYPFPFISNTLGSNSCTCVYDLDIKRPSYRSFDFLNSTTGGCFISLSIFL